MPPRMKQRRGSTSQWTAANPILGEGEFGIDLTTGVIKVGDGVTDWVTLPIIMKGTFVEVGKPLSIIGTVRAIYAKTTSQTEHVATFYQAATSGSGVALNVISDNPEDSAMYLSGTEKTRGTLKIAHTGQADGSDASASGLSIDTRTSGSAARGIYLWSTDGGQAGDSITIRRSAAVTALTREDFVVKANGRCGIGTGLGSNPAGMLDVIPYDTTTPAVTARGIANGSDIFQARRASDGAVRTRISRDAQIVTQETAFFTGPAVMISSSASTQVGGGTGCLGMGNASVVPTTNPSGGGVLYADAGALWWRGSGGTVTKIANA